MITNKELRESLVIRKIIDRLDAIEERLEALEKGTVLTDFDRRLP